MTKQLFYIKKTPAVTFHQPICIMWDSNIAAFIEQ